MHDKKIGFALGGLAGNNSHGAGFLYATLERDLRPAMITCTSGQIRWVYQYLASNWNSEAFKSSYLEELGKSRRTGNPDVDFAFIAALGYPKVFRPAYEKWGMDIAKNGISMLGSLASQFIKAATGQQPYPMMLDQLTNLTTNRILVPLANEDLLNGIASEFNNSNAIGIAFNSYDPKMGVEHVYLNEAARGFLYKEDSPTYYQHNKNHPTRHYRIYRDITNEAVRDALWLYAYGFGEKNSSQLDGAFFRDVMLAELSRCDLIFSVRPISHRWIGSLPRSYQTNEDLKTEVAFNGAYAAERDQIIFINKLLRDGVIDRSTPKGAKYKNIELLEIESTDQWGYYEYALESRDVFLKAREETLKILHNL